MSVTKKNGFNSPYRSQTFQNMIHAVYDLSGMLKSSGLPYFSGLQIKIPPFDFVQEGLLVEIDAEKTLNVPPDLPAPYFVAVSSPTTAQTDDLIYTFIKTPDELTSTMVLIAQYDGTEWKAEEFLTIDQIIESKYQDKVAFNQLGVISGLSTINAVGGYTLLPGTLHDKIGQKFNLQQGKFFPEVVADSDANFERIDRIVYRRDRDNRHRPGVREYITGGAYNIAGPETLNSGSIWFNPLVDGDVTQNTKVIINSANEALVFAVRGYGAYFELHFSKWSADRATMTFSPVMLVSASKQQMGIVLDSSENIHVTYTSEAGAVSWAKFSSISGLQIGTTQVLRAPNILPALSVKSHYYPTIDKIITVFQILEAPSRTQLYFVSTDLDGNLITGVKKITNTLTDITKFDIFFDKDLVLYVAWEETTFGKIYYRRFDDIGDALETFTYISGNTDGDTYGTLIDIASDPQIWVTDNKTVFVGFLQIASGNKKFVIYTPENGAKARDWYSALEDVGTYHFSVNEILNAVNLTVSYVGLNTVYIKIEDAVSIGSVILGASAPFVSHAFDKTGSLFHIYTSPLSVGFGVIGTSDPITDIGGTVVGGLSTVVLGNDELLLDIAGTSYIPRVGGQLVLTGSFVGNNGTYNIIAVTIVNLNALNDSYVVRVSVNFTVDESPAAGVFAAFYAPNANDATKVKSISEFGETLALRQDELDSDNLLARIKMPGNVILNVPTIAGGDPGLNTDLITVYGTSVQIDWEKTLAGNLTLAGSLGIKDLLENIDYTVIDGSYPMSEEQAIYVTLDGVGGPLSAYVVGVPYLPWADDIFIIGFIKNGEFNPVHMRSSGMGQLDSGESVIIGEDLPIDQRDRLGITGENTFQAYTNTHRILTADTHPETISKLDNAAQDFDQDRNIKMIEGGEWTASGNILSWDASAFVQTPTCDNDRNEIPAGNVTLATFEVAYVTVNRDPGAPATLAVSVALIDSFVVSPNTFIIARKTTDGFIVGTHSFKLLDGESKSLDAGTSWQTLTAVGLQSPIDEGPLKIKAIPSSTRVRVTPINGVLHDGTTLGDEFSGLFAVFAGCQIDLETGNYYGYGDGTIIGSGPLLGSLFTPTTFTSPNLYRWYSVQLTVDTVPGDGTILLKPMILLGTDGISALIASRAVYSGKKMGQVVVSAPFTGVLINNIAQTDITQLSGGTGSGGGGILTANLIDYVTTSLPATTATPIDGETIISGHTVLFTKAPIAGYYSASVVGIAITWTSLPVFSGSATPSLGDQVSIKEGTNYNSTVWAYGSRGWKPLDPSEAELEPTGWVDASQAVLSFVDGTRTLSITPVADHFDVYQKGKPYRFGSAQSIVIANTEGMHFVYLDEGILYETTTFTEDIIKRYVFVASIYWDAVNVTGIMVGYELHGCEMDGATHAYLHSTVGTRYASGLGLGGYTTAGTGASNADAQMNVGGGVIFDEDIKITIIDAPAPANKFEQILSPTAMIPIFYRTGASGLWRRAPTTTYPIYFFGFGDVRAVYNNPAGPWTSPQATTDGNYIAMWLFATNNISEPVIAIMGQREDTSLSDAQANNTYEGLLVGNLPILEMKVMYRLIFQTDSTYTNAVRSALRDVRDLRRAIDVSLGAYAASDHGLLSGLNDLDHPTLSIYTGATNATPPTFIGGLSASDMTVADALDTLDKTLGQLRIKKHTSLSTRVTIADSVKTLNDGTTLVQSLKDLLVTFSGAQIDFQAGNVYASNGVTVIGTFTPATIGTGDWRWYSVYLTIDGLANAQNQYDVIINVIPATADGASKVLAISAPFGRKTALKLGQVAIQGAGGASISAINQADIKQLGTGGGGGGGGDEYTEQTVINNQVAPVDVLDFYIPPAENKAFQAKYSVIRRQNELPGGQEYTPFYSAASYGPSGYPRRVLVLSDNSIVMAGSADAFNSHPSNSVLAKLKENLSEDTTFYSNYGSGLNSAVNDIAKDSSDSMFIVHGGSSYNGTGVLQLFKILSNGTIDPSFTAPSLLVSMGVQKVAVQPDDKVVMITSAFFGNTLYRLNTDGTEDTAFTTNLGTSFDNSPQFIKIQSDGKILVAGPFTTFNGNPRSQIVRLNSNGTEDTSFYTNLGTGFDSWIGCMHELTDGKILLFGAFTTFNGNARTGVVRLNNDGTEDVSFYTNISPFSGAGLAVTEQSDGKILIAGNLTTVSGTSVKYIARLQSSGSLDTVFSSNVPTFNSNVESIALVPRGLVQNDRLVAVGIFNLVNGNAHNYAAMLQLSYGEDFLQTGRFSGLYSPRYNDWTLLGFSSEGVDAGVAFTMLPTGQLQYASNDLSIGGFTFAESVLRWTVTRL